MRMRMTLPAAGVLTVLFGAPTFAAPVVVTCAPGHQAIVRDSFVHGAPVTSVECVDGAYRSATVYRTSELPRYRVRRPHRSWAKSALIIGGSAATGAGIGGIIDGKKGALIGGALGGGVSSLFEGTRRR